ncbi:MAG: hydroxymethylbilane synthase [Armatimonadetes bacterium]|nr:hydroxymethylbilane synthase [Armatimonadota bacterium]
MDKQRTTIAGTRGSLLALHQTDWVMERLKEHYPEIRISKMIIKTQGDKILDVPLAKIGDKGLFVKELETALLEKEIDFAVHSMKDVPTEIPSSLTIGAIPRRESPQDAFISPGFRSLEDLPKGARVGTSSLRRKAQILHMRPDLEIEDLRGNLDTRLRKLDEGQYDAIILASAGLRRLGLEGRIRQLIPVEISLPAVGQGALAVEIRRDDRELSGLLQVLHDPETALSVEAERSFLTRLEGGCQVPLGALARIVGGKLTLDGVIVSLDGKELCRDRVEGPSYEAASLGIKLAEMLLSHGGAGILEEIRGVV